MNYSLWLHKTGGHGPWPLYLDTYCQGVTQLHIVRRCVGYAHSTEEPSGIYLRSLKQQARTKIESLIAMESYQ